MRTKALLFLMTVALLTPFAVLDAATLGKPADQLETCATGGPWVLVYRYTVNIQEDFHGTPIYETREVFDGQRFPTEADAYCGARNVRRIGVVLPTLDRYGRDSNVFPESITPMPSLQTALAAGIREAH